MSDKSTTFDISNFSATMQELTFFRTRQLARPDDANSFFQAQREVAVLRKKLERIYHGQRAKRNFEPAELWALGLAAYHLITSEGKRIGDVSKMSGNKLIKLGKELSTPIQENVDSAYAEWIERGEPEDEEGSWNEHFLMEQLND